MSDVFTGVPLGAAPDPEPLDAEVAEDEPAAEDEVADEDADVDVDAAAAPADPVAASVDPPHAANALTPTAPAPRTPAARTTVRRSIWFSLRCSGSRVAG